MQWLNMPAEFEKRIADFIKANRLFCAGDKVLLAISGGADSTALLYAMQSLKAGKILDAELFCAHINHRLRGAEADADEQFVIAQASELNLTVTTERLYVREFAGRNKLSIETAARQLRIKALVYIAKANGCEMIATAHHKNDNAETVLQRLVRGTGFRGLAGIWPTRTFGDGCRFVRPLLCVSRNEILDYLRERNLQWRTDHTNADCTYTRNYIRHRLLPVLQRNCSGSLVEQLSELSESARRFYRLVCSQADEVWPKLADSAGKSLKLDLNKFLTQPQPVEVELVRRSLVGLGCGEGKLTQRHFEKILQLSEQNISGRKIELPGGFMVQRQYENLIFCRVGFTLTSLHRKDKTKLVVLQIPGKIEFGKYVIESKILEKDVFDFEKFKASKAVSIECFDADKIRKPLVVRFRQSGDKFIPLGLGREKKVGKFLTDAKVPCDLRDKILIVADSEKIIWVFPIRMSEQARVCDKTQKILQLQITQAGK
jgi:tRNA(Ile)-lysidine synthase